MSLITRRWNLLLVLSTLVALLTLAVTSTTVHAQTAPQAASTCRGTLTLSRTTTVSGGELQYAASGLEPNAAYTISIGGQLVARATTSNAGTTGGSVLVPVGLGTTGGTIQVSTATTCAAATLTVIGQSTFGCPFVTNTFFPNTFFTNTPFGCGFIPAPVVTNPLFTTFTTPVVTFPNVVTIPSIGTTRTCIVPGSNIVVAC